MAHKGSLQVADGIKSRGCSTNWFIVPAEPKSQNVSVVPNDTLAKDEEGRESTGMSNSKNDVA